MELYGGGMVGKSTNYQLGGQIARSKRGREYQVELADLKRRAERDAENRSFRDKVGGVGKFVGNLIAPGFGDVIDTTIQSGYKAKDYSGGKYAQGIRDDLTQQSEDYKSSVFERGLVGGLQTALMPELYSGIKEELGKGVDYLKGLRGPEASAIGQGSGLYQGAGLIGGDLMSAERAIPGKMGSLEAPSLAPGFGQSANPYEDLFKLNSNVFSEAGAPVLNTAGSASSIPDLGLAENIDYGMARDAYAEMYPNQSSSILDFYNTFDLQGQGFNRQGGMIPKMPHGGPVHTNMSAQALANMNQTNALQAAEQSGTATDYAGTVNSPISTPTPTMGAIDTNALSQLSASGFNMSNFLGGAVLGDGSGVDLGLQGQMDSLTAPPQNQASGQYGTAIGTTSALNQMGMQDIANDPRLQEYLEDLPQFGMGYRQQFGDIQSGGRQALSQMYANQRNMGGGFAGAGAGAQAFGQGYSGLMGEQARQRRGVVEGFQSDLLSAIGDIEDKGEFEFGSKGLEELQAKINVLKKIYPDKTDDELTQMAQSAG